MNYMDYRAYFAKGKDKQNKYKNDKCEYNGKKFDSKKERNYYILLLDRERDGEIRDLQTQVTFELQPSFKDSNGKTIRAIKYIADFVYYDTATGKRHIVDVKGSELMITEVFKIKQKMFEYRYGEKIEVVIL